MRSKANSQFAPMGDFLRLHFKQSNKIFSFVGDKLSELQKKIDR